MDKNDFWQKIDDLVNTQEVVIDRPKGSTHPRYADYIYPFDYGYLKDTISSDGGGLDVWVGSQEIKRVTAVVITFDSLKGDVEPKLLIGCSEVEIQEILKCHRAGDMVAEVILRKT